MIHNIFKACDIRGIYGVEVTDEVAYKIGIGIVKFLKVKDPKLVIAGDVRLSTPILKKNLIKGIVDTGGKVFDIGIVPTPVFNFANRVLNPDAGVMVTASHNPKEYNGFKIVIDKLPMIESEIGELKKIILSNIVSKKCFGKTKKVNIIPEYKKYIRNIFKRNFVCKDGQHRKFKVVIDAGNGCYSEIAPYVFDKFGFEVIKLNCRMDGSFPNRGPNPANRENLKDLCKTVRKRGADIGIAFDGDGDRVVFVSDKGEMVNNDKSIIIFIRHILKDKTKQKIVYDVKCSSIVKNEIIGLGSIPIMERSGYAYIKRRMIRENAIFGAELSGHFFFNDVCGDDGLYASIVYASIIKQSLMKVSELLKTISSYFTTSDVRIPFDYHKSEKLMIELKQRFNGYRINTTDGIKVQYDNGWVLIRRSIAEPLLTLRFEGYTKKDLHGTINAFVEKVPEIKKFIINKRLT